MAKFKVEWAPADSNEHRDVRGEVSIGELMELMERADPDNSYVPQFAESPGSLRPLFYSNDHIINGVMVYETRIKVKNTKTGAGATFSVTKGVFISHASGKKI